MSIDSALPREKTSNADDGSRQGNALIVFSSKSGACEWTAQTIADVLAGSNRSVSLLPLNGKKTGVAATVEAFDSYDLVVCGSGVRMLDWHSEASDWLKANAAALRQTVLALFSVSLNAAHEHKRAGCVELDRKVAARAGVVPAFSTQFPGWFKPANISRLEAAFLKTVQAKPGDYTDESAVRAWALSLLR